MPESNQGHARHVRNDEDASPGPEELIFGLGHDDPVEAPPIEPAIPGLAPQPPIAPAEPVAAAMPAPPMAPQAFAQEQPGHLNQPDQPGHVEADHSHPRRIFAPVTGAQPTLSEQAAGPPLPASVFAPVTGAQPVLPDGAAHEAPAGPPIVAPAEPLAPTQAEPGPTSNPILIPPGDAQPASGPIPAPPAGAEPTSGPIQVPPAGAEPTSGPILAPPAGAQPTSGPILAPPAGPQPTSSSTSAAPFDQDALAPAPEAAPLPAPPAAPPMAPAMPAAPAALAPAVPAFGVPTATTGPLPPVVEPGAPLPGLGEAVQEPAPVPPSQPAEPQREQALFGPSMERTPSGSLPAPLVQSAPPPSAVFPPAEPDPLPDELLRLRASIDNFDAALVHLLAERFKCTQRVGVLKAERGLPPSDIARETEQIARLRALAGEAGLDPVFAEKFLSFIVAEVIRHHEEIAGGARN